MILLDYSLKAPDFGQGADFKSKQATKQINNLICKI